MEVLPPEDNTHLIHKPTSTQKVVSMGHGLIDQQYYIVLFLFLGFTHGIPIQVAAKQPHKLVLCF